jgi:V8-like Glu-specific endopeptidase
MKNVPMGMVVAVTSALMGCAVEPMPAEAKGESNSAINGGRAVSYPDVVHIDSDDNYACTGTMISPHVVLTAGHCLKSLPRRLNATAANAGRQSSRAVDTWTNYKQGTPEDDKHLDAAGLDVGVMILEKAITIDSYPTLAFQPVDQGTPAFNVGRVLDGQLSDDTNYEGKTISLALSKRASTCYESEAVVTPGDSGGPVYIGSGADRKIVAVASKSSLGAPNSKENAQLLARVDLVFEKLSSLIAKAEGGTPADELADQPTAPAVAPDPAPAPAQPPPPAPTGDALTCDGRRATGLQVVSLDCSPGGIVAQFFWTPGDSGNQYLDVAFNKQALFDLDVANGFQGQDLQGRNVSSGAMVLLPDHDYAWRINTIVTGIGDQQTNWCPSIEGTFHTPACP